MRKRTFIISAVLRRAWLPARGITSSLTLAEGGCHYGPYLGSRARRWWALTLVLIGGSALLSYVIAVNAILLAGVAIREHTGTLQSLERESRRLQQELIRLQSPAWLVERSRQEGMVRADGVRYLATESAFTLRQ